MTLKMRRKPVKFLEQVCHFRGDFFDRIINFYDSSEKTIKAATTHSFYFFKFFNIHFAIKLAYYDDLTLFQP